MHILSTVVDSATLVGSSSNKALIRLPRAMVNSMDLMHSARTVLTAAAVVVVVVAAGTTKQNHLLDLSGVQMLHAGGLVLSLRWIISFFHGFIAKSHSVRHTFMALMDITHALAKFVVAAHALICTCTHRTRWMDRRRRGQID